MPVKSLTKRFLDTIKPKDRTIVYIDKNIKNLILRHHPTNKKSFYICIQKNGTRVYRFIGAYPTITPEYVREVVRTEVALSLVANLKRPIAYPKSKTLLFHMDHFLKEHSSNIKQSTKKLYGMILKNHIIPAFGDAQIAEIDHSNIVHFKQKLSDKQTTYNRCHQLLCVFFNYCVAHSIIQNNPVRNVRKYKENHRTGHFSSIQYNDFIQSIYKLLDDDKISKSAASCITFIVLTGCRLSEALTCKWSYIDYANNTIQLPDSKTGAKTLYIGDALKTLLQSLPKNNDYIFPGRWGHSHLVNINRPFKMILQHANIKEHFTIHHLRHSYISLAANGGIPINAVQLTVGHASQATTERYTHTDEKLAHQTAQAVENLIIGEADGDLDGIMKFMR